jgi:FAD/FMN-containing dehydrogenase
VTAVADQASTADEVRAAVMDARRDRTPLEVRGGGSVLDQIRSDGERVLSIAGLDGVVAHAAEDLTITVLAGLRVTELTEVLAAAGQECPIEPTAAAGSTVGGRVAAALATPRQLGAGRVRDWLLRVRFVTGAGQLATAGGVTVKDVTGYDLCRLLTGSWGTIGVITEVTLKLRPIARHRRWYRTQAPRHDLDSVLYRPASLITTPDRTHVLLEGHPEDAADQAALVDLEPSDAPTLPRTARAAVDPARLSEYVAGLGGSVTTWAAQDGVGVCHLDADAEGLAVARRRAEDLGGSLLVLDTSLGLPAFGDRAPSRMAARVAAALDPDRILAPWRWTR